MAEVRIKDIYIIPPSSQKMFFFSPFCIFSAHCKCLSSSVFMYLGLCHFSLPGCSLFRDLACTCVCFDELDLASHEKLSFINACKYVPSSRPQTPRSFLFLGRCSNSNLCQAVYMLLSQLDRIQNSLLVSTFEKRARQTAALLL